MGRQSHEPGDNPDSVFGQISLFEPTVREPEEFYVWLGRLFPEKGAHLAIQAAREAGVPLVLAGTVDQYVPESVCYFREVIQPQLDGRQITYLGPVNMQQKIDLFSRARALLNPLQWEELFGMVMIEAMAVGCPVIAFPYGAAPEIVAHGRSGFLARHVDEMVQSIKQIDRLDRSTVRAYAEAHFSARVMAEQYVALYRKVIASAMDGSRHGMPVASSARGGELDLAIA